MIIYDIGCENGHRFEGWFTATSDYDTQVEHGLLSCPVCGSQAVRRVPTASRINTRSSDAFAQPTTAEVDSNGVVAEYVEKLKDYIEQNYDDVGEQFPEEARRIYYGESEARNLRGVAGLQEVSELLEEGIAVVPLPGTLVDRKKLN